MGFFEQVYVVVRCIPPGRVATYGQIARLLGQSHAARTVGWALRGVPEDSHIPWQRVVNASGRISIRDPQSVGEQRSLLEAEGLVFGPDDQIDLDLFGWEGLSEIEVRLLMENLEEPDAHT